MVVGDKDSRHDLPSAAFGGNEEPGTHLCQSRKRLSDSLRLLFFFGVSRAC
jgi:hypothetical protein